ncbi:MAG: HAD-IIIA family hydrolase [Phototrophicaceae bacterium]|jgi:D-glycero-D-manno-heptose 1,7-bisphosphate phosphatase
MTTILIVGGDSTIGAALNLQLRRLGHDVFATTRRASTLNGRRIYVDLRAPAHGVALPDCDVVVLCVALTGRAAEEAPELSQWINVTNTIALAKRFHARGAFVVFLSSSGVFDGETPNPEVDTPTHPLGHYAEQKAAVERELLALGDRIAIARLTKIISKDSPLLAAWRATLTTGEPIFPLSDYRFAPLSVGYVARALARLIERRAGGIWHFSPQDDLSYAQAALIIAAHMGVAAALVQPRTAEQTGIPPEGMPANAALGVARSAAKLNLRVPVAKDALGTPAVFMSREGIITQPLTPPIDPQALTLLPGAAEAIARLKTAGYRVIVAANEPSIAKGTATEADIAKVHEQLSKLLAAAGTAVDAYYICPHHPQAEVEAYRQDCECRKPRAGMLFAARDTLGIEMAGSFIVGDNAADTPAGVRAGVQTILLKTTKVAPDSSDAIRNAEQIFADADKICDDLSQAVNWILGE